jgi:Phage integrase, N-terminal SAM-like domain
MTEQAMSPLRRRMIEDMMIRKFAQKTQHDYVQRVKDFASYLKRSPDTAKPEDVRGFQLHLVSSGAGVPRINVIISALRFFFKVTQFHSSRSMPSRPPPQRLRQALSPKSRKRQSIPAPVAAAACASSRPSGRGNSPMLREALSTARRRFRQRPGSTPHDDNLRAIAPKSRSPVRSLLSRPRLSSLQSCLHYAIAAPLFTDTPARVQKNASRPACNAIPTAYLAAPPISPVACTQTLCLAERVAGRPLVWPLFPSKQTDSAAGGAGPPSACAPKPEIRCGSKSATSPR